MHISEEIEGFLGRDGGEGIARRYHLGHDDNDNDIMHALEPHDMTMATVAVVACIGLSI